jgi:hypothetical protein
MFLATSVYIVPNIIAMRKFQILSKREADGKDETRRAEDQWCPRSGANVGGEEGLKHWQPLFIDSGVVTLYSWRNFPPWPLRHIHREIAKGVKGRMRHITTFP